MKPQPLLQLASIAAIAVALLPGCESSPTPSASSPSPAATGEGAAARGLPDGDSKAAHDLVAKGAILLDVRSGGEFADKHLPGAVNVPVDEIDARLAEIEKLTAGDKKTPIVVYCSAGGRSRAAKKLLVKAGYESVMNLGAMSSW